MTPSSETPPKPPTAFVSRSRQETIYRGVSVLTDHMAREEEMARPDGLEPPTTWFEEVTVEFQPNRNNKLDGPPSLYLLLRTVESRQDLCRRYVFVTPFI